MDTSPLKIGYCLSLSGGLASNGKTAQLAHQIWQENLNQNGGLLGRPVELVCLDDQTNPNLVAGLYQRLFDEEKVDLVIGGYGDNSVAPAMPLLIYQSPCCSIKLAELKTEARAALPPDGRASPSVSTLSSPASLCD